MINQLLKFGALIATGRFLKPRIKGVLYILLVWLLLWFVHSEFVDYVELSGDTRYVLQASLLKLFFYALSVGVYVWKVERKLWPKTGAGAPLPTSDTSAASRTASAAKKPAGLAEHGDGFDFIRQKKKLKSRAEQLLGKND